MHSLQCQPLLSGRQKQAAAAEAAEVVGPFLAGSWRGPAPKVKEAGCCCCCWAAAARAASPATSFSAVLGAHWELRSGVVMERSSRARPARPCAAAPHCPTAASWARSMCCRAAARPSPTRAPQLPGAGAATAVARVLPGPLHSSSCRSAATTSAATRALKAAGEASCSMALTRAELGARRPSVALEEARHRA